MLACVRACLRACLCIRTCVRRQEAAPYFCKCRIGFSPLSLCTAQSLVRAIEGCLTGNPSIPVHSTHFTNPGGSSQPEHDSRNELPGPAPACKVLISIASSTYHLVIVLSAQCHSLMRSEKNIQCCIQIHAHPRTDIRIIVHIRTARSFATGISKSGVLGLSRKHEYPNADLWASVMLQIWQITLCIMRRRE